MIRRILSRRRPKVTVLMLGVAAFTGVGDGTGPATADRLTTSTAADARSGVATPMPGASADGVATDTGAGDSVLAHRSATLDQLPSDDRVAPVGLRLDAGAIGAPVVPVSAEAGDGELAVPPSPDLIAWYKHGPSPGEPGSAVLAAHVDWQGERGAFFELASVPIGALAVVTLADGTDVSFRVVSREQVEKSELPTVRIFARTGPSQLALVTCGGAFDRGTRQYADNIVVIAVREDR